MATGNILVRSKIKQAQSLVAQNKLTEAKSIYAQLYSKNKIMHIIGLELAVVHRKLGEFKETESICRKIIKVAPKNAAAHHVLGSALQCLNQFDDAINEYKLAIKIDNKLTEAHYFLGNIYRLTGNLELAAESLYAAVELNPNFYEALNNLAAILVALNRPIEAKIIINQASAINPNSIQLMCNFAGYCLLENNKEKALEYANKAYNIDPTFVDALRVKARIHYQNAEYDNALDLYRKAYAIRKDDEITCLIVQILERRGEFDEANELITPLIKTGKTDVTTLLTYSTLSRKFNNELLAIDAIENKINNTSIDKDSLIWLHFELGKQYDLLKEYDKAFGNYTKANTLDREKNKQMATLLNQRQLNYISKEEVKKWLNDYPKEFWDNLPNSDNQSSRPIFVIGMFRSGTTLCEQILASHPEVHGAGELDDIYNLSESKNIKNSTVFDNSPASLTNITKSKLNIAASNYLKTLDTHSKTAKHVVDKMPSNFGHVGFIAKLFPNAHIIHMIRDPRDSCLSMYFQKLGAQMTFSTDLFELAEYHLAYQQMMQYWNDVLDIKIHHVVYEELMADQENITRKMLEFCGLKWNDKCLSFHQSKRDVHTPSYDQVRKPIYKKSVARWKNYESQIQPLIKSLGLETDDYM